MGSQLGAFGPQWETVMTVSGRTAAPRDRTIHGRGGGGARLGDHAVAEVNRVCRTPGRCRGRRAAVLLPPARPPAAATARGGGRRGGAGAHLRQRGAGLAQGDGGHAGQPFRRPAAQPARRQAAQHLPRCRDVAEADAAAADRPGPDPVHRDMAEAGLLRPDHLGAMPTRRPLLPHRDAAGRVQGGGGGGQGARTVLGGCREE